MCCRKPEASIYQNRVATSNALTSRQRKNLVTKESHSGYLHIVSSMIYLHLPRLLEATRVKIRVSNASTWFLYACGRALGFCITGFRLWAGVTLGHSAAAALGSLQAQCIMQQCQFPKGRSATFAEVRYDHWLQGRTICFTRSLLQYSRT